MFGAGFDGRNPRTDAYECYGERSGRSGSGARVHYDDDDKLLGSIVGPDRDSLRRELSLI